MVARSEQSGFLQWARFDSDTSINQPQGQNSVIMTAKDDGSMSGALYMQVQGNEKNLN